MKGFITLKSLILAALALSLPTGLSAQNNTRQNNSAWEVKPITQTAKSKKKLYQENSRLRRQLDSLNRVISSYKRRHHKTDSMAEEIIDIYKENEDKIGAGLRPEDYTPDVTDSLLSIWYLQRQIHNSDEGEDYDMDSVRFTSNVSDKTMLKRLESMNSFITLPYNETVRNYMILYSEKMPTKVAHMIALAQYYFPIFEETFNKYSMPEELKFMAVIESALNSTAVSRAGAKGMWQFMYTTAKHYGLKINSYVDERFDPYKSADAAARYLDDAYRIFGDWNLAISSYNCGAGNVTKAIRRAGGNQNFWDIYNYLPRETRGYVPAFVGAMYAFHYYKEYGIKPDNVSLPAKIDTFQIHKNLHFQQISSVIGVPMQTLRDLNPQYIHDVIPGNEDTYVLRLPYEYTSNFIQMEDSVYNYKADELFNPTMVEKIASGASTSEQRIVYKVRKGDYLGKIASKYHVTVSQIKKWNNLRSNNLRIGQSIVIYRKGAPSAKPQTSSSPQTSSAGSSAAKSNSSSQSSSASKTDSTKAKSGADKAKSDSADSKATAKAQAGASTSASEPAAKVQSAKPEYTVYTVKKGDTLYSISIKYPGVSANDIMTFNGIGSSIQPGQKLKIPTK